jgi:hypothetical protein
MKRCVYTVLHDKEHVDVRATDGKVVARDFTR